MLKDAAPPETELPILKEILIVFLMAYIIDIVSVALFEARGGEGHAGHALRDVGNVQVVLVLLQPVSLPAHNLSEEIHSACLS